MGIKTTFVPAFFAGASTRFVDRLQRQFGDGRDCATGFVYFPNPGLPGSAAKGRQLLAGNLMLDGSLIEGPFTDLWRLQEVGQEFDAARHSFVWLNDLAELGDDRAREAARDVLLQWIDYYGAKQDAAWRPDQVGTRLIEWIGHALFLLNGMSRDESRKFFKSVSRQAVFLEKNLNSIGHGKARFEALTALIFAGLSLEGLEAMVEPAVAAMAVECESYNAAGGDVPSRNPEELVQILTYLIWATQSLRHQDLDVPPELDEALYVIAPVVRTLTHSNGDLARFHGGHSASESLRNVLPMMSHNTTPKGAFPMGYARMSGGRSTLIADVSPPAAGAQAHASTLAFEFTTGRRRLIVNCGSGAHLGPEWHRASRATPCHSTLSIDTASSAQLCERNGAFVLTKGPREVDARLESCDGGLKLGSSHDAYLDRFGLLHERDLMLSSDGSTIEGEDRLICPDAAAVRQFDRAMDEVALAGIPYSVRFHVHPDVSCSLDMGGVAVSMELTSGEMWVFRLLSPGELRLEPSFYLEKERIKPRATQQVIFSDRLMEYSSGVRWSLTRARDAKVRHFERVTGPLLN